MESNATFAVNIQTDPAFAAQVDEASLQRAAAATLRHQNAPPDAALSLIITGDKEIQQLNRQFRQVNAPTDVLAFPSSGDAPFVQAPDQSPYLGDVILSYPRAAAQAAEAGHPVAAELALLAVHGTLHLLGHDHAAPQDQTAMWAAQQAILATLGLALRMPHA